MAPRVLVMSPDSNSSYEKSSSLLMCLFSLDIVGNFFAKFRMPQVVSSISRKTIDDNIMS